MKARKRDEYEAMHVEPTIDPPPISKQTPVFAMGSCFALEVSRYLLGRKFNILLPNYPYDYDLIWYNTYSIRDEFRRVLGNFQGCDVWELKSGKFQDPYRREVVEDSMEFLVERRQRISKWIETNIRQAAVVVITLGLTEVWFENLQSGTAICSAPPKGDDKGCGFRATDYNRNLSNMVETIEILREVNPSAQVILTVSPVPLFLTFRKMDNVLANMESKSILRAVAGMIVHRFANVHYFHSYEMAAWASLHSTYRRDGRHVRATGVARIMAEFERHFVVEEDRAVDDATA